MLRALASLVFAFGILGLFQLNRDPDSRTSKALWIPVTWLLIIGSRSVSQWLGLAPTDAEQAIIEGNPFDRVVYLGLLTAGMGVTTNKNTFGVDCLVLGLGSLWCFLESRRQGGPRRAGPMIAQGTMVLIALFLVLESNSMTSLSCLVMAGGLMLLTVRARKPAVIHLLVVAVLSISFSALFLNFGSGLVEGLGR